MFTGKKIRELLKAVCFICLFPMCVAWGEEKVPDLASFPKVNRIWIGLEDGSIRPKNYDSFKADAARFVLIHAADGEVLKKNQHWLTIEPEELELERKSLQVEEEKYQLKLREEKWAREDLIEKKQLLLDDLESKRKELENFLKQEENLGDLRARIKQGLSKIEKKIERIEKQIDPANVENELELFKSEGLLNLERKRKRFELMEKRSKLKTSFAGKLELSDSVKQKLEKLGSAEKPIWIETNTTIATIIDEAHYEVVLKLTNAYARKIDSDQLMVLLQDSQTGNLVKGSFDRMEEVEAGVGIKHHCIFRLDDMNVNVARHSSGESHLVHIYRKFPQAHSLVHKKDIAFIAPAILKERGWSGLVKHLWPSASVLQVGPQSILIKSLDEN